jgi:hypothetical protein
MKEKAPIINVSMSDIVKMDPTSCRKTGVLPLIWGRMRPRWSIVARFPANIPPMPPLIVRMGGNNARIQGEEANWGVRMEMSPPAKMLSVLKEMAMRVWADVDL